MGEAHLSLLSDSESLPLSCLDGDGGSFFIFTCLPSSSDRDFGVSLSFELFSCLEGFSAFALSVVVFSVMTSLLKFQMNRNA